MLTATPGHGRITRVTLNDRAETPGQEARLVPFPNTSDVFDKPDEALVPLIDTVDLVVPQLGQDHAVGLILTLGDAPSARALAVAARRAADLLARKVPAGELDSEPVPGWQPVKTLVADAATASRPPTSSSAPATMSLEDRGTVFRFCAFCGGDKEPNKDYVHAECLASERAKAAAPAHAGE